MRDDVVEVKLKPSLGEGGKARAPSHAHGGWWRAVGAAERSTHWSSPSSLASISRHAFVKRSASHTTFEIVLAVETRRSPRSLLVSCRISDACDVMRRRRRESDMAVRELPRQNSATMERICLFGVHDGAWALPPCPWALYLAGDRYDSFSERPRDELGGEDCRANGQSRQKEKITILKSQLMSNSSTVVFVV